MPDVERSVIDVDTQTEVESSLVRDRHFEVFDGFPPAVISVSNGVFGPEGHILLSGDFSQLIVAIQRGDTSPEPVEHEGSLYFNHNETVWIAAQNNSKALKIRTPNSKGELLQTFHRERKD